MKRLLPLALLALPACALIPDDRAYTNEGCRTAMYGDPTVLALERQAGNNTTSVGLGEQIDAAKRNAYNRCIGAPANRRGGVEKVQP